MTQKRKILALSLVIATCVTVPTLAKGGKVIELEGFADISHSTKYSTHSVADVSGILDLKGSRDFSPPYKKFHASGIFADPLDSFSLERIAQKKATFNRDDTFDTDFSVPQLAQSGVESGIFTPEKLMEWAKEAEDAKARQKEAQERSAYDAFVAEHDRQLREKYAADQAALTVPSYQLTLGDYLYSAGASVLNRADYVARSWPTAFLIAYTYHELLEEGFANVGYATAAALSAFGSGGNLVAAHYSGQKAYYGVKAAFELGHLILPHAVFAGYYAGNVQTAINVTLDTATLAASEAVRGVTSTAQSVASYFRSYWT